MEGRERQGHQARNRGLTGIVPSGSICLHPQDAQEAAATTSPAAKPKPNSKPSHGKSPESPASRKRTRVVPRADAAQPRKRPKTASPSTPASDESALSSVPEDLQEDYTVTEKQSSTLKKKPRGRKVSNTKRTKPPSQDRDREQTVGTPLNDDSDEIAASELSKANGESRNLASESDMSEVLDEAPTSKKKGRKATATSKEEKKPVAVKLKDDGNIDPQEAEIKRLQSWLLKCGIRKMWYKELARYTSSKAKINHLKGMLKDAGMDGRYSVEKAKQIKEERELKAELEAVQEGAKHWGEPTVTESDDAGRRPTRRLAKGLREFDFLGDDGGEETD